MIRKQDIIFKPSLVYAPNGAGLGDILASINFATRLSDAFESQIKLSTWYFRRDGIRKRFFTKTIWDAYKIIDSAEKRKIEIVSDPPDVQFLWTHVYGWKYINTDVQWLNAQDSDYVCYQFDGRSHKRKNFTKEEEEEILAYVANRGIRTVNIGQGRSLYDSVRLLSYAKAFIGIDSGMTHLSLMCGTPTIVTRNGLSEKEVRERFANNEFVLCSDAIDLQGFLSSWSRDPKVEYEAKCRLGIFNQREIHEECNRS